MTIRRLVVPVTTDENGDGTAYASPIYGNLISIRYVKTDFDDGVDFVITTEDTHQTLWSEEDVTASATRYPRAASHSTAGVAAAYAALGEAVNSMIDISAERIKVVVANGGDTTSGTFHFTIQG